MARVIKDRKPLPEVKCGDTKCDQDLHAYRPKKKPKGKDYEGTPCHNCGDSSIDWITFSKRNLSDVEATILTLKKEYVRHVFWNIDIDRVLRAQVQNKGKIKIEKEILKRLETSVKEKGEEIFRDSTQTPMNEYNIIYFAQHATATCCRKCIKIWHNIPYDKVLDKDDLTYLKNIVMYYINERVPMLKDDGAQLKLL